MDEFRRQAIEAASGEARGWSRSEMARRLRDFSCEAGHPISPGRDGIWY